MKKFLVVLLLTQASFAFSSAAIQLTKFVPRNSFLIIGSDYDALRTNEVFVDMERKGQIWSQDDDSQFKEFLRLLKIDPRRDIRTMLLAKYVNSYGNKGEIYILELIRSIVPQLEGITPTEYLGVAMYRLDSEEEYAVEIAPNTVVLGSLKEVKTAVDVSRAKMPAVSQNVSVYSLLRKLPNTAAVWGVSVPFSRRQASELGVEQSTNAVLEAFENYYFYGIPKRTTADAYFIGQATGEKEAAFVSTFMIGTLTFAKLRVEEEVADILDQVQIDRNGKKILVHAIVTKELVDAYFDGDLGVD